MLGSEFTRIRTGTVSRYDLVLAVIPVAFLASALVGLLLSLSTEAVLTTASVVAAVALLDALLINPPRRPRSRGGTA